MTLACIREAFGLFSTNTCEAVVLVAFGAIVGVAVAFAVCRLVRPCCKSSGKACGGKKGDTKPRAEKPASRHPAPADGSIEIYVGNLSYDLTDDQLRKEFEAFGTVNSARVITNRYNNKSKGFGFVHMPNRDEADAAVAALNDKEILGRKMKCNEARNVG